VTIKDGGTALASGTLSKGKAKITLPARSLPAGIHTLTAEYGGDSRFGAASDTFTATVTKATSTTNASISPPKPRQTDPVTLSVLVRGSDNVEATGQVSVTVDGSTSSATLANGRVSLDLGTFGKGTHKITVVYLSSANVAGSQDSLSFKVG
jgi:hypothetical protein